jgi:ligand-binding sensor domain-containing protein
MKLTKILICLLIFWTGTLSASPYFSFKKYQVEDGLSHNTVWCALQDSYGFIWLGTSDGLNRYDGRGNKVYRNVLNDKFSLENNLVGVSRGHYNMMLLAGIMEILSATIKEMRVGPSQSVYRNRLQTITSCVLSNQKVVNVVCNKSEDMVRYV